MAEGIRLAGLPMQVLGLTKERSKGAPPMFERFTDRARRVVVLAQEEARMLN
ncbi:MAG: hypothetical protein RL590_734, partial [Actinomycetota bacterium]